jgi:hypothetical protein
MGLTQTIATVVVYQLQLGDNTFYSLSISLCYAWFTPVLFRRTLRLWKRTSFMLLFQSGVELWYVFHQVKARNVIAKSWVKAVGVIHLQRTRKRPWFELDSPSMIEPLSALIRMWLVTLAARLLYSAVMFWKVRMVQRTSIMSSVNRRSWVPPLKTQKLFHLQPWFQISSHINVIRTLSL